MDYTILYSGPVIIGFIKKYNSGIFERCASRSVTSGPRASRSVLCSSHTFKFISYNLILKLKPT